MSTPQSIISEAQLNTHTNENNYPSATFGIQALNNVNDLVNNEIAIAKQDYFWDEFKVESVIGQSEYNITTGEVAWDGSNPKIDVNLKKINKILVKYDSTATYHTRLDYIAPGELEKDLQYYSDNQSTTAPFFYIQDRSIFLYPAPTEVFADAIKINAIYTPPKVALTDTESWFALQVDKHYIYSIGMEWQIYKSQGKLNESQVAKQQFDVELAKVTTFIKNRSNQPKAKTETGLDEFR